MRTLFLTATIAAALVAAAPASAQRASLADRVAVLEQRAANNQGNVDLLNQVTQLKSEVQALRSQLEELNQQAEQQKQTSRSQYLDLDGRLNRFEAGAPSASGTSAAPGSAPAAAKPSAAVSDRAPTVHGDAGTLAQGADERGAYDTAFASLKAGQYVESARLFAAFLQNHPDGVYAPNAHYWLGESYYVTQNYQFALQQFQLLLERYPTHDKAPGAMLKVGLSQLGLKQFDAAERTLSAVESSYPGTDAARTASDRLGAIRLGRLR